MPFQELRHPKVYVPNQSYHDFSDATRFGELVFLTQGPQDILKLNTVYRRVGELLRDAIAGDYLLISGPITVNAMAASILAYRFGRVKYLIFDGASGRYVSKPILLSQVETRDDRPEPAGAASRDGP